MNRTMLLAVGALAAGAAQADKLYKCTDPSTGGVTYSQIPCGGRSEKLDVGSRDRGQAAGWTLIEKTDDMTGGTSCVIESQPAWAGKDGEDFLMVSIRVTMTGQTPVVGIYSRDPLSKYSTRPPLFHNDIDGLGIRVDEGPFVKVDLRAGERVLGFMPEKSATLVSDFAAGSTAGVRVRYWPYDEVHDAKGIPLSGFGQAMQQLRDCNAGRS